MSVDFHQKGRLCASLNLIMLYFDFSVFSPLLTDGPFQDSQSHPIRVGIPPDGDWQGAEVQDAWRDDENLIEAESWKC